MASDATKRPEGDRLKEVTMWRGRLAVAKAHMLSHGNRIMQNRLGGQGRIWDDNVRALAGDFNSQDELGNEAVDVNITHTTVTTLFSPLWTTDPYITVTPTAEKFTDAKGNEFDNIVRSRFTEREINHFFKELRIRERIGRPCIHDVLATNCGYAYLGQIQSKAEITNDDGETTEPDPTIKPKQPFIDRICPKYVLIPPGNADFEKNPWIGLMFLKPLKDVKDLYEQAGLEADATATGREDMEKALGLLNADVGDYLDSDDAGMVWLIQIWDKRTKKLYTLTESSEDYLEDPSPWPVDVGGYPVEKLDFNLVPDETWATPEMTFGMPQQKELNMARTQTAERENRTKAVVFMTEEVANAVKDVYKAARDGEIIALPGSVDDIRRAVMVDPGLPPNQSAYAYGGIAEADYYKEMGLGQQQRGQGDPNIGSATASAIVDKWAVIRQTNYGDRVRSFYLGIARKLWRILCQFPNVRRDVLIVGSTGALQRVTYDLSQLDGEYSFDMDLSVMLPDDPQTRQRNALARYNLFRPDPKVNADPLIEDVFRAFNIHDVARYQALVLSPEEEFSKMLQGLPTEAHELDDIQAHDQAHAQQAQQLQGMLDKIEQADPNGARTPMGNKVRLAMSLLVAHMNDHARIMAEMTKGKPQPGQPVQANALRAQTAGGGAGETPGEMGGQPMAGSMAASPDGVPVG